MYIDNLNYRTSPLVVRYRYLKVQNGELFFYQQLSLSISCRFEEELLGNYTSYRERYLSLHPDFQKDLANHITPQIADILTKQLDALKLIPLVFPQFAILNLPEE
ncbi:unnamed protein product [Rhizophagus irregularis]|nr:unnamed protein product [Rhizophagus irregularis]